MDQHQWRVGVILREQEVVPETSKDESGLCKSTGGQHFLSSDKGSHHLTAQGMSVSLASEASRRNTGHRGAACANASGSLGRWSNCSKNWTPPGTWTGN